jgi:hypothetical protein
MSQGVTPRQAPRGIDKQNVGDVFQIYKREVMTYACLRELAGVILCRPIKLVQLHEFPCSALSPPALFGGRNPSCILAQHLDSSLFLAVGKQKRKRLSFVGWVKKFVGAALTPARADKLWPSPFRHCRSSCVE